MTIKTTKDIIKNAGLNYDYYINEAKSIVRELDQGKEGNISASYLLEKINNVKRITEDINEEIDRQKAILKLIKYKEDQ